jgi:putative DNA primase/helicase
MKQPKINRVRYWKKEKPKSTWELMVDAEQDLPSVVKKGAMFVTWNAFSESPKGNGHPEPIRFGDLPLDFDSKEDPEKALKDLQVLCLVHLPEIYGIDPYDIKFYCSGSKGFHAVIPAELFGAENGDPYLPVIYKRIVSDWEEKVRLATIDLSMYAMGKGKMFRIPNVRRNNGRYKVPLTLEEVRDLAIGDILKLSEAPRNVK